MSGCLHAAHGDGPTLSPNGIVYFPCGTTVNNNHSVESQTQTRYRTAGTFSGLWFMIPLNSITAASTGRFRVGAADVNQVVTITTSTIGEYQDTTHTDTISAGNDCNVKLTAGGTGTSLKCFGNGMVFAATTNTMMKMNAAPVVGTGDSSSNGFATYYQNIAGYLAVSAQTETDTQYRMKGSGTFANMSVRVLTNTLNITQTMTLRKNAAAGNNTISIGNNVTGLLEDTTHSDTFALDDLFVYQYNMGGTGNAGSTSWASMGIEATYTGSAFDYIAYTSSHFFNPSDIQFIAFVGAAGYDNNEINDWQILGQVAGTVSLMHTSILTNTLNQAATLTFRKNQANGNQTLSVTASTTGDFVDTTHTDVVATTDELAFKETVPAGSGTAQWRYMGSLLTVASSTPLSSTLAMMGVG